ncbi:uncharacterized protein VTP21DRAFT_8774 [Calcarisporiella thermophila]|uniref:uncharacterized protein n=1 Tax=Calcarisporiella thermophila TaxID=911321 RepID=UPI003743C203
MTMSHDPSTLQLLQQLVASAKSQNPAAHSTAHSIYPNVLPPQQPAPINGLPVTSIPSIYSLTPLQLLSLSQSQQQPQSAPLPPSPHSLSIPTLDLSQISPEAIRQVREQIQQQSRTEEKEARKKDLSNADSISPEVLVRISELAKEGAVFTVLQSLKKEQAAVERELWGLRERIVKRQKAERDELLAKELLGDPQTARLASLDRRARDELAEMDRYALTQMDEELHRQQVELHKAGVPLFRRERTTDPAHIAKQRRVLELLLEMMPPPAAKESAM